MWHVASEQAAVFYNETDSQKGHFSLLDFVVAVGNQNYQRQ